MPQSFTQIATTEAVKLLAPLQQLNNAEATKAFLKELGWDLGAIEVNIPLGDLVGKIGALFPLLDNVLEADDDAEIASAVAALAPEVLEAFTAIKNSAGSIRTA